MLLKDISPFRSGGNFACYGTVCAILEDSIIRSISVKLFRIWASDEMPFNNISYLEFWQPF